MKIQKAEGENFLAVEIPQITVPVEYSNELVDALTQFQARVTQLLTNIYVENDRAVYEDNIYQNGFHYFIVQDEDLREIIKRSEPSIKVIKSPVLVQVEDNEYVRHDEVKDYFFPSTEEVEDGELEKAIDEMVGGAEDD